MKLKKAFVDTSEEVIYHILKTKANSMPRLRLFSFSSWHRLPFLLTNIFSFFVKNVTGIQLKIKHSTVRDGKNLLLPLPLVF